MSGLQQVGKHLLDLRDPEKEEEGAIFSLLHRVFGQENEARLVERLRGCGALVLERIAADKTGRILAHLALSRVTGAGKGHRLKISCLVPACVEPELQKSGVGSLLIQDALDDLQGKGEDLVLTLGAPEFYSRFGFDSELAKKVQGPFAGPIFMALPFTQAGREDLPVEVTYATPFEEFE